MIGFQTITRRRSSGAETRGADGRTVAPATVDLPITATLQRPTAAELRRLPGGWRTADPWFVDSPVELRTLDELGGVPADLVVIDGVEYQVAAVADESQSPIPHYEATVIRVPQGRTP